MHKKLRRRNDSPSHHDYGDPTARAESGQHEAAGYREDEIARKEDASSETVGALTDSEISVHRKRGEANVHTIQKCDEVHKDEEWSHTPANPTKNWF